MKNLTFTFLTLCIFSAGITQAQNNRNQWVAGIGYNVVDNGGDKISQIFDVKEAWNIVPYPCKISIEKMLQEGFSVEGAFTYNQMKAGKIDDHVKLTKTSDYFAFDLFVKYDLYCFFDNSRYWLKPYLLLGYGYADLGIPRTNPNRLGSDNKITTGCFTNNLGLGVTIFVYKNWGLNFQTMAKFTQVNNNHLQHSVSVIYKFNSKQLFKRKTYSNAASDHIRRILSK